MSNRQLETDRSLQNAFRAAGVLFLSGLILPLLNWIFVLSRFIDETSAIRTAQNIVENDFLFRFI